jgi:RHS repeat-associated protein
MLFRAQHTDANGKQRETYTDHAGQTRAFVEHPDTLTGSVTTYDYRPTGELAQIIDAEIGTHRRRLNDKYHDASTGLAYYGYRYYDQVAMNWTQSDPLFRFAPDAAWDEPRRASLYAFSGANPLRYLDPDGRSFLNFLGGTDEEHPITWGRRHEAPDHEAPDHEASGRRKPDRSDTRWNHIPHAHGYDEQGIEDDERQGKTDKGRLRE